MAFHSARVSTDVKLQRAKESMQNIRKFCKWNKHGLIKCSTKKAKLNCLQRWEYRKCIRSYCIRAENWKTSLLNVQRSFSTRPGQLPVKEASTPAVSSLQWKQCTISLLQTSGLGMPTSWSQLTLRTREATPSFLLPQQALSTPAWEITLIFLQFPELRAVAHEVGLVNCACSMCTYPESRK